MKLWAICIGDSWLNKNRYVAFHPDFPNILVSKQRSLLAVTDNYQRARTLRKQVLASCNHKSVFIVKFIPTLAHTKYGERT